MSARSSKDFPQEDPYEVLGIDLTTSISDIHKAYRKLALQLHPDKIQHLPLKEQELAAERFQKIQEAKAFLTEPEHSKAREKYDLQRASQRKRQQVEEERNKALSETRKRMREDLAQEEKKAKQRKEELRTKQDQSSKVQNLKKKGEELQQQYADKAAAKAAVEQKKDLKEERQVRLKWSRKKLKTSPTEHSIAELLQQFGAVEAVEFLGSKGNAALITFVDSSSCQPCVGSYADSEEMRATFVGKRKEREEKEEAAAAAKKKQERQKNQGSSADSAKDWKAKRAAEREHLLREMEHEEVNGTLKPRRPKRKSVFPFPPQLPGDPALVPAERLEQQETMILKDLLSAEKLQSIKFTTLLG